MITESTIYWMTRLDEIKGFCIGMLLFSIFTFFVLSCIKLMLSVEPYGDKLVVSKTHIIVSFLFFLLFSAGVIFTPTTREYAAMKVIPMIANNQDVKELGSDVIDLAKDWLKQLKPKEVESIRNKDVK